MLSLSRQCVPKVFVTEPELPHFLERPPTHHIILKRMESDRFSQSRSSIGRPKNSIMATRCLNDRVGPKLTVSVTFDDVQYSKDPPLLLLSAPVDDHRGFHCIAIGVLLEEESLFRRFLRVGSQHGNLRGGGFASAKLLVSAQTGISLKASST